MPRPSSKIMQTQASAALTEAVARKPAASDDAVPAAANETTVKPSKEDKAAAKQAAKDKAAADKQAKKDAVFAIGAQRTLARAPLTETEAALKALRKEMDEADKAAAKAAKQLDKDQAARLKQVTALEAKIVKYGVAFAKTETKLQAQLAKLA